MKLTYYELQKVIGKKIFLIVLLLSFVINIFLVYYQENTEENQIYITYAEEYNSILDSYKNLPIDIAEEKVNGEILAFDILNSMNLLATAETDEEMDMYNQELINYKKDNPDAYKKAELLNKSNEDSTTKALFFYDISNQINYIKSYPEFISNMKSRADMQTASSIFSDENSFSYNNLYKTADDYAHLKDIKLSLANGKSTVATKGNTITDLFVIGIVLIICIYLFNFEREKNLYSLVKSSKNGGFKTIISKIIVLFLLSATISIIFTASDFIVNNLIYGSDDLSRNIQSLQEFRNCNINVSVGLFLLLFALTKVMGILLVAGVFSAIFVLVKTPVVMYIFSIGITMTEFLLYTLINPMSAFEFLKYINFFYMLDSGNFAGQYLNINIFSNTFSAQFTAIIILSVIAIVLLIVTCIFFCRKSINKGRSVSIKALENIKKKYMRVKGSTVLFFGESYKYLIESRMIFFILLLVLFGVFNSIGSVAYSYTDVSDVEYKAYMEQLEGVVTKDKIDFINKEKKYFESLETKLLSANGNTELSDNAKQAISNSITNIMETKGVAFEKVLEQYSRITKLKNVTPKFIDEKLYDNFVSNDFREWKELFLFIILLIISLPVIFTIEYKNEMIKLISPTSKGKINLAFNKYILSFLVMIISFTTVYIPYYVRFISTYGTGSMDTSLMCLYENGAGFSVESTMILKLLCCLVSGIFILSVINLIATKLKSNMLVMIFSSIVFLVPTTAIYTAEDIRFGNLIKTDNTSLMVVILIITLIISAVLIIKSVRCFANIQRSMKLERKSKCNNIIFDFRN